MNAPQAKRIPYVHKLHGDDRPDDYFWLREKENPEVIQYLEEENKYHDHMMGPLHKATDALFEQMVARIPEHEAKVPVRHGNYYYYSRIDKTLQYPVYARKEAASREHLAMAHEEIILDSNTLAVDGEYLSVTEIRLSPSHMRMAYLENRDGTDRYTIFVKDFVTGETLPDRVENVFIGDSLEWNDNSDQLFYVRVDESQRPYQLWTYTLGDSQSHTLLYEESDVAYSLRLSKSRSGRFIFLRSECKTSADVRYWDFEHPEKGLQLFEKRRAGIEYEIEHWGNDLLLLTNENATNFTLLRVSLDSPNEDRTELMAYDETRYLQAVYPFQDALLLYGRQGGLTQLWTFRGGELTQLNWDEPVFTVTPYENRSYHTTEALLVFESFKTPKTTLALDLVTGATTVLDVVEVPGSYDSLDYVQERHFAKAKDGVDVPFVMIYRRGALDSGPAPLILYGYGSYGSNVDPRFDSNRIPLLDVGVVWVSAQIRGGSEMGHGWYEDGKLFQKRNTFTDFIAVAEDLIARGFTTPEKLAGSGRSAGGLLIGAVANMAGHLFQVMIPGVPFVDVVTTMLDASIPLTSLEWDEWGNPEDADYYQYMKSYSPYDNVEAKAYPHMLVTTGLNDPRVGYWEAAKWVARLRELKTDGNQLLLKTHMGAGHFGSSGRFNHLKELAASYAFILDKLGVSVN